MTLAELCEPLFQYVCLLNRSARKGGSYDSGQVRSEIKAIFTDIRSKAKREPALGRQYEKIEPALIYFTDAMIRESGLSFAAKWQTLFEKPGDADDDDDARFFDLLDETLHDPKPDAVERLQIFYTCLGLGYTGWHAGQPDHLRRRMLEISARTRGMSEMDAASRIVPEAYEHVNTSNLIEPPGASVMGIVLALACLLVVLFAANLYLYKHKSQNLSDSLDQIVQKSQSPGAESK